MIIYRLAILFIPTVSCMPVGEGGKMDEMTNLKNLRSLMTKMNISAYIIPSADDHLSEYLLDSDKRRDFISGFTGSSGTAVVTEDKAALWTDSRYTIQAKRQLDLNLWTLLEQGEEGVPKIHEWLADNLKNGSRVGVDPKKMDSKEYETNKKGLGKKGIEFVSICPNLIDEIWEDKPPYPEDIVYVYDIKYAGESWESKVDRVQKMLNGSSLIVSALDEVAWLTNLRGSDFRYSPIFRSFLILDGDQINLYIPLNKVTQSVRDHFKSDKIKVNIESYEKFWDDLVEFGKKSNNITVPTMKRGYTSYQIQNLLPSEKMENKTSPVLELKSYKNKVEADGMRRAHVKDSVALCQVMMDITNDIESKNDSVVWDELRVVSELERLRGEQELNMGSSFATISAFGPNSALPHYKVTKETNLKLDDKGPLTIDSGGQYLDGTIDTTRVVRAGKPTKLEINVYTALLRGIINLAETVFPEGTKSSQLEFIARRPLYHIGRDFGHGITHGTGSFLNVHEGYNGTLRENFIGSQEPGYYKEDDFGMRLENLVIVVPAPIENHTKKKLLTFEPLTLVPYERKLIDLSQLEKSELKWLNDYHKKVRTEVGAEILKQEKKQLYEWLLKQTEPLKP